MENKNVILGVVLLLVVGSIGYLQSTKVSPAQLSNSSDENTIPLETAAQNTESTTFQIVSSSGKPVIKLPDRLTTKKTLYSRAKEISTPDGFINLPEGQTDLKIANLIGKKVILVDFWTYSCINCQRTTPYLNAWYDKYRDQGLEIIGIHTPEFDFEKNYQNVRAATQKEGIKFPVVLDNDYSTWTSYGNRYWPRKYLIDIDGFIVYDHIGEGGYEETETQIQKALRERVSVLGLKENVKTGMVDPSAKTSPEARSPETYFGASRNQNFGSGNSGVTGAQSFSEKNDSNPDTLYLVGNWNILPEYAETAGGGDHRIAYRYQAKGVYFVAGAEGDQAVEIEVREDGKPIPTAVAGADIIYKNGKSYLKVKENRLYRITDRKSPEEHLLEMIISSPGLQAYTFTFG